MNTEISYAYHTQYMGYHLILTVHGKLTRCAIWLNNDLIAGTESDNNTAILKAMRLIDARLN